MYALTPQNINRALLDAGCTIPADAQAALDTISALRAAAASDPVADLSGDVTPKNAAMALRDLAGAMTARQSYEAARIALEQPLSRRYTDTIRAHVDDLITQMKPAFDAAAEVVHRAGKAFPPGSDKASVLDAGDVAVAAYRELDGALGILGTIRSARATLADLTGEPEQDVTWFITGAHDLDALAEARRIFHGPGHVFHALAWAGYTLTLNTKRQAAGLTAKAAKVTEQATAARTATRAAELREENAGWLNQG